MEMLNEEVKIQGEDIGLPLLNILVYGEWHIAKVYDWQINSGWQIFAVLSGDVSFEFGTEHKVHVSGGRFVVVPPHCAHRGDNRAFSPAKMFWMVLQSDKIKMESDPILKQDVLSKICERFDQYGKQSIAYEGIVEMLADRLHRAMSEYDISTENSMIQAEIKSLIYDLFFSLYRSIPLEPEALSEHATQAAISFIHKNFMSEIGPDDIVKQCGLTRTRFFRTFREATGCTPMDYLQRYRIEQAQILLKKSEESITQVAYESGFSSSQYFALAFKRHTHQTPSAYRAVIRRAKYDRTGRTVRNNTPSSIQISLGANFDVVGIYTEGSSFNGGIDRCGCAFSASQIPSPLIWDGIEFSLGMADLPNVMMDRGQIVGVTSGAYESLRMLAVSLDSPGHLQLDLNYSDGSKTYHQQVSNWCWADAKENEATVATMWSRLRGDGSSEEKVCYIYGYLFKVDTARFLESITFSNSGNVAILSMALTSS